MAKRYLKYLALIFGLSLVVSLITLSFYRHLTDNIRDLRFVDGSRRALYSVKKDPLKYFKAVEYGRAVNVYPVNESNCKWIKNIEPFYRLCAFDRDDDLWLSGNVLDGNAWEPNVAMLLKRALNVYSLNATTEELVFLDVGASIGSHALFIANQGFQTWAVEPLTMNLVNLYHAALLSNLTGHLTLVHNAVSEKAGRAMIRIMGKNIGGSEMAVDRSLTKKILGPSTEEVQSVLLRDIINAIVEKKGARSGQASTKLPIVLKLDVSKFECRAILGSKQLFFPRNESAFFIPYIFMEWILTKPPPRFGANNKE